MSCLPSPVRARVTLAHRCIALAAIVAAPWLAGCLDTSIPQSEALADVGVLAPPVITLTWPADGTVGVPDELPRALIALRLEVSDVFTGWRGPTGAVPHRVVRMPCRDVGAAAAVSCFELRPTQRLATGEHQMGIDEGTRDTNGAPTTPSFVRFQVSALPLPPAEPIPLDCERDETSRGDLCVRAADEFIALRVATSGPARVSLRSPDLPTPLDATLASTGVAELRVGGLTPETEHRLEIWVESLDGATQVLPLVVETTPPLARWRIAEVLASPIGADPAQEFVELVNDDARVLTLDGYSLADAATSRGDTLPSRFEVPPGGRALIVGASFDPGANTVGAGTDAPFPPGVPVIRVDGPIGSGGLNRSGEALYLRDRDGRRIDETAAVAAPDGRCVIFAPAAIRGRPGEVRGDVTCTPGRPSERDSW